MSGVSLSAMGLRAEGGRKCPQGGGHEVHPSVIAQALREGQAEGRCVKCKQSVRLVDADG